jgi:hypothetical protein
MEFCLLDMFVNNNETSYTIRFKFNSKETHKHEEILNILEKLHVIMR